MYDYLIVGAGLSGTVFAYEMNKIGKKCIVIDKRNHIGGNVYTEKINSINVHKYGAHIFHTNNKEIWDYINQFAEFNNYINSPIANYNGKIYNLPFNMNTFSKLWGITKPEEAKKIINSQKYNGEPSNLEEQALFLVGKDIYETLVKDYTEKQWGKPCKKLPAFIINRLPIRFTYDNNYFNDKYQGIPIGGYTQIINKMLDGIEVKLCCDYFEHKDYYNKIAKKIVFTGPIDKYYDYKLGRLEWRSLKFKDKIYKNIDNYQGNAVVNYTGKEPYTRIIEHKHFEFNKCDGTIITKEFPTKWKINREPYYPINNNKNNILYQKYEELANKETNVLFLGRLGKYKYINMDEAIIDSLKLVEKEKNDGRKTKV